MDDEAETRAAFHDHHWEFGTTVLYAVDVRDLRPRELAVQRIEPGERSLGPLDRDPLSPRCAVAGLIQDMHDDVLVAALLVAVLGVQGEGEVVDGIGVESDAFAAGSHRPASVLTARPP